jgi:ATPase family associated with various cellular activities (AAA)
MFLHQCILMVIGKKVNTLIKIDTLIKRGDIKEMDPTNLGNAGGGKNENRYPNTVATHEELPKKVGESSIINGENLKKILQKPKSKRNSNKWKSSRLPTLSLDKKCQEIELNELFSNENPCKCGLYTSWDLCQENYENFRKEWLQSNKDTFRWEELTWFPEKFFGLEYITGFEDSEDWEEETEAAGRWIKDDILKEVVDQEYYSLVEREDPIDLVVGFARRKAQRALLRAILFNPNLNLVQNEMKTILEEINIEEVETSVHKTICQQFKNYKGDLPPIAELIKLNIVTKTIWNKWLDNLSKEPWWMVKDPEISQAKLKKLLKDKEACSLQREKTKTDSLNRKTKNETSLQPIDTNEGGGGNKPVMAKWNYIRAIQKPKEVVLNEEQKKTLKELLRSYKLWEEGKSILGFTPRPPLLVGLSGCGKTTLLKALSIITKKPLLLLEAGTWSVMNAVSKKSTVADVKTFMWNHGSGIIAIDECDKFGSDSAHDWFRSVRSEAMGLIEHRVDTFLGWNASDKALLENNFYIIGCGTWQELLTKQNKNEFWMEETDPNFEDLNKDNKVSEELLARFSEPIYLRPPSANDFRESLERIHKEIKIPISDIALENLVEAAVDSRKNNRWIEDYVTNLLKRGSKTLEIPEKIIMETEKGTIPFLGKAPPSKKNSKKKKNIRDEELWENDSEEDDGDDD